MTITTGLPVVIAYCSWRISIAMGGWSYIVMCSVVAAKFSNSLGMLLEELIACCECNHHELIGLHGN